MNALQQLMDRFDLLSMRERVIIVVALVMLLALVWDQGFQSPLERKNGAHKAQVESLRAELAGLNKSIELLVAQGAGDPRKQGLDKAAALKKEIAGLDVQLAGATSGLIAPKEMAQVLRQLLARTSHLTLDALRTLAPEAVIAPISADNKVVTQAAINAGSAQIYRHGVEIEVSGTYLEALDFLEQVEALPWRFFWDKVEYKVEQHPQGRLKLTLYTLGLKQGWIGV